MQTMERRYMDRKNKPDLYIEPMPKKRLRKIIKAFERQGGKILMGDEIDEYLREKHALGSTLNKDTIMLAKRPGRATVFEELIHAAQYRLGRCDGSAKSVVLCEIEAQEKLLANANAYGLTDTEISQTKKALDFYKKLKEGSRP